MKNLNNIAKVIVLIVVITLFIFVVAGCAYISGNNNSITIDRKFEIDLENTIKNDRRTREIK